MDEISRPATLEDLKALINSLNENKADYLLIGGYALFVHGYHRATVDIDILVRGGTESGEIVKQALLVLPDQSAKDIDLAWFEEGDNIRVADEFIVDVMLNACGETYETLIGHMIEIDLDGVPIRTVDLRGLLKTKLTTRDKDALDRMVIERALDQLKS